MKAVRFWFIGFRNGWKGVVDGDVRTMSREDIRNVLPQGGTLLGTARFHPHSADGGLDGVMATLEAERIDAYAYNPGRADKLTRLHMVTPVLARRLVWLPESDKYPGRPRNWIEPLLAQLCAFTGPGSIKHDDFVDSASQALRLLMDKRWLDPVKARKDERDAPPPKVVTNPYAA